MFVLSSLGLLQPTALRARKPPSCKPTHRTPAAATTGLPCPSFLAHALGWQNLLPTKWHKISNVHAPDSLILLVFTVIETQELCWAPRPWLDRMIGSLSKFSYTLWLTGKTALFRPSVSKTVFPTSVSPGLHSVSRIFEVSG